MVKIQDLRSITPRSNPTRALSQIKFIARHHSGTTSGDWHTFWPHWNKIRGWGTGGYAEIILRDGTVQICYDPHEITNGVANHNTSTYNICIVGNGSFTAAQEEAWDERCRAMMKRLNLPASAVKGHNEFSGTNTACPGIDMNVVRARLNRKGVAQVSNEVRDYFALGDNSPGVSILQSKLNKAGFNLSVDGIYGKGTESAVTSFQRTSGLVVDGIAGKATLAKLDTIIAILSKPSTVKKKEDEDMLKQAIVIGGLSDYAAAEMLAVRKGIPLYPRSAIKGEVANELIVVGGSAKGLKADKVTVLSGADRFETAANVKAYLNW